MVKKWVYRISGALFIVLFACIGFITYSLNFRPLTIDHFFLRVSYELAKDSPETLTTLHILENFGITGHQKKLDSGTLKSEQEIYEKAAYFREMLLTYEDQDLTDSQKLSKDIMLYLFNMILELEPFQLHNYPVNQLFGFQSRFPSFMDSRHQIHSVSDAEDYLLRLKDVRRKFAEKMEGLKLREANKIIPPKSIIRVSVKGMRAFVEESPQNSILYTSLKNKMNQANISLKEQQRILSEATLIIDDFVYPAYQELIDYFSKLEDVASDDDGYWKMPRGDQAYRRAIKLFTTSSYSPDYLYDLGLKDTARIQSEIMTILKKQGIDVSLGFTNAITMLANDERFYYADSDLGRQKVLDDYKSIIHEMRQGIDDAFQDLVIEDIEIKRIPKFKEQSSISAYYEASALDGSKAGTFFVNLHDLKATPKYSMRTLAYHETFPGHHLQISNQRKNDDMPLIRRLPLFAAYQEGWGLYAERLAWELGYHHNPFDNVGRLQSELFRSVRLVVDTGIHHKRWSREKAIEFMMDNTGMTVSEVTTEIDRYIVLPGQALAYKVGMMKILELREKSKAILGNAFSLKEFHSIILKNGAVPLEILEQTVAQWIEEKNRTKVQVRSKAD